MKLLPYHTFEIRTMMSPAQAVAALQAHLEPVNWFRLRPMWPSSKNDKRFQGEATEAGFKVWRLIGYRNSFLPTVIGTMERESGGTRITIRMRLLYFVMAFVLLWITPFIGVLALIPRDAGLTPFLFALGMLGFMYALTMGAFWYEASKQERVLREIFRAL